MADTFRAIVANKTDDGYVSKIEQIGLDQLSEGDVVVDVAYSTLNYKDGLAVTGKGKICESFPMVCGIDFSGTVASSDSADFKPGDQVVLNGYGLSQNHSGGYAEKARVRSGMLVKLPDGVDLKSAMAVGTAGYTAMLCVLALEKHGVGPKDGEVLVTGAAGGVGSVAVSVLAKLGYTVVASTGRESTHDYLKSLGAAECIDRNTLSEQGKPFQKPRWAGVVDTVGSHTLANALAQTKYGGCVAACGLAGGPDLSTTVLPFILRGVTLAGIDSVEAPMAARTEAWARLAVDLPMDKLNAMTETVPLEKVLELAPEILKGQVRGRVIVDVNA
ncbi:MAG: MDR family oxidoreductase [Minwuia sp.]|uniref:acrylyl-CoA reductase (NADPH) n=1 Tax=Minwuia sp. TaxID=2493630 RepID=UPI003A849295